MKERTLKVSERGGTTCCDDLSGESEVEVLPALCVQKNL